MSCKDVKIFVNVTIYHQHNDLKRKNCKGHFSWESLIELAKSCSMLFYALGKASQLYCLRQPQTIFIALIKANKTKWPLNIYA
jgi:hypothetical protein